MTDSSFSRIRCRRTTVRTAYCSRSWIGLQLSTLASFAFYRSELGNREFRTENIDEQTGQLRTHYARVRATLQENYDRAVGLSGKDYVDNMLNGLQHWVDGADRGYLAWGIMDFRRD